jgi:hypothetical protein
MGNKRVKLPANPDPDTIFCLNQNSQDLEIGGGIGKR